MHYKIIAMVKKLLFSLSFDINNCSFFGVLYDH